MIEDLDLEVRKILESSKSDKTPEDAERAVADEIGALVRRSEGHLSLTDVDLRGRTPLMLAARGSYPLVVKALLADPSVKLRVNQPDADGVTAWMLANFAPTLTLVACQPGTLTRERYVLLPPYLRRMGHLLQTKAAAIGEVITLLRQSGAEADEDAAKRLWLAQCPNATPALREALAGGRLMQTLVNEALARQQEFNETATKDVKLLPEKPPDGMKFTREDKGRNGAPLPALDVQQLHCVHMEKPQIGTLQWSGNVLIRAVVKTSAGVVETVDFETMSARPPAAKFMDYFRAVILRALAGYQCKGDHTFEQEFEFDYR
ncbi:hypothetical protein J2X16_000588 [Pelomonas aquatica]|uniref:Ankyrin repeat domain-containing protein n=1 Tax=Pelomonas aquatica TaxID=431058 RepID=A0ABU1Z3S7_9BURK|nr:hypothetical protein [Pelomonas aquatica]MDR7295267.1 hypothetical protein [Pelomonas aquatica]